jgi:Na+-transporting methylmalonyl-CoA/oxaloacetate decarboxylase gamma subunit
VTTLAATSASSSAAPGTLGFIVVFGLAVILVFVFRSMSKHIRKVNDAARRDEAARSEAAAAGTGASGPDPGTTAAASSPGRRDQPGTSPHLT